MTTTTTTTTTHSGSELVPHAHRMTLWGSPSTLDFPPICPNCGNAAANRVSYSKVFQRSSDSDTPVGHVVIRVAVPFCDDCIAQHRAQTSSASLVQTVLSSFATGDMQTSVTQAFDYSDSKAAPFESDKFTCTMRDERFAAAFRDLNRQFEFDPNSLAAVDDRRAARREFWTVGVVVAAIALFFLIRELLK